MKRGATIAFCVMALLMVGALVIGLTGRDSDPDASVPVVQVTAREWVAGSERALAPFQQLPDTLRLLDDWRRGAAPAATVDARLAALRDALAPIEPGLVALGPHPDTSLAAPLHIATARLYLLAIDAERAAVSGSDPAIDLSARRLIVLANRIFDRGRAAVGEGPAKPIGPDVVVHRPSSVPSWREEGLGADSQIPAPPSVTSSRSWSAALQAATDFADAASGPTDRADRLEAASTALASVPDAGGDLAVRARLGLLLRAEAARLEAAGSGVRELASDVERVAGLPSLSGER